MPSILIIKRKILKYGEGWRIPIKRNGNIVTNYLAFIYSLLSYIIIIKLNVWVVKTLGG